MSKIGEGRARLRPHLPLTASVAVQGLWHTPRPVASSGHLPSCDRWSLGPAGSPGRQRPNWDNTGRWVLLGKNHSIHARRRRTRYHSPEWPISAIGPSTVTRIRTRATIRCRWRTGADTLLHHGWVASTGPPRAAGGGAVLNGSPSASAWPKPKATEHPSLAWTDHRHHSADKPCRRPLTFRCRSTRVEDRKRRACTSDSAGAVRADATMT